MVSRCESRCQGLGYGGVRFRLHVVIQDGPAPAVQAESTGPSCRSERGPVHGRPVDRRRASVSEGRWLCPNRGGCREGRHIPRRIRGPTVRDQQRLPGGRTSLALGTETSTIGEERRSSGVAHTTTSCFYVICHVRSKHSDAPATIRAALDRPAAARLAGQTLKACWVNALAVRIPHPPVQLPKAMGVNGSIPPTRALRASARGRTWVCSVQGSSGRLCTSLLTRLRGPTRLGAW